MWKDVIEENFRYLRGWEIQEFIIKLLCSCSVVSDSATPWTIACQAPLSMAFPRQEYWSGLPFPSPGYRPDPGIESRSPALQADS